MFLLTDLVTHFGEFGKNWATLGYFYRMVGATTSQNVATLQQVQVVKVLTLSEFISILCISHTVITDISQYSIFCK